MAKPEWGTKRICPNCATRYYDLGTIPPICPACGTPFDPEALLKSRRARTSVTEDTVRAAQVKAQTAEVEEDEVELAAEVDEPETTTEAALSTDDEDINDESSGAIENVDELDEDDDLVGMVDDEGNGEPEDI